MARLLQTLPMRSICCSGSFPRHCCNEVGSGDDPDELSVFQNRYRIDIRVPHQRQQRAQWRRCDGARHCDAHDVECQDRLVSFRVDQATQSRHQASIEAQRVFSCTTDQMYLENDAKKPLLFIDHGERCETMAPEEIFRGSPN